MQRGYWENEYYRSSIPFYYCPFCQSPYEDYSRFGEDQYYEEYPQDFYEDYEGAYDASVRYPIYGNYYNRNKMDMDVMVKLIFNEIAKNAKYIVGLTITKELLRYLIKVVAEYLEQHHEKYLDPIEQKIQSIMVALRRDLRWVFDVLAVFGVTPDMAVEFVEDVVRIFLREIIPVNAAEQSSPMWGV